MADMPGKEVFMMLKETRRTDPELAGIVDRELIRQEKCIEMIASESTVPVPVMELSGSGG